MASKKKGGMASKLLSGTKSTKKPGSFMPVSTKHGGRI